MSVLNPFFRQQVQDPGGVSTGATPMVDTWTDEMKMKNALIDEQLKAVNASFSAYGAFVEAKAQIKEEENKQVLKNVANDIAQDAVTMVQGYKNQLDFQIGEFKVEKGKKGFHAYSDLENQIKRIKEDVLKRLQDSHNPNGEDKLSDLIESAVDGAFIDPTAQSNEYVMNHIHNRSLADLSEVALASLSGFNSTNYNAVIGFDQNVDKKLKSGALDPVKAENEKIEWRKDAFKQLIYEKLPLSATAEQRREYIKWFRGIIDYKKNPDKIRKQKNPAEAEFYEKLSILDIKELNRGLGAPAFLTPKQDQLTTLTLMSEENPLRVANMFDYRIEIVPNKDGKPTFTRLIPKTRELIEHTFTAKEGWLSGFLSKHGANIGGSTKDEKVEILASMQVHEETGNKIRSFSDTDIWPKGLKFVYPQAAEKGSRVENIERVLNENGFGDVSHTEVVKILKSTSSQMLKQARASYKKSDYDEGKLALNKDVIQYSQEWASVFSGEDPYPTHGFLFPRVARPPLLPDKRGDSESKDWASIDPRIQQLNINVLDGHQVMNEAYQLLREIESGNIPKNIRQMDSQIEEIKTKMQLLVIQKDAFHVGARLEPILKRALFEPYNRFRKTWGDTHSKTNNRLEWCKIRVSSIWEREGEKFTDTEVLKEANRCFDSVGIRSHKEIK